PTLLYTLSLQRRSSDLAYDTYVQYDSRYSVTASRAVSGGDQRFLAKVSLALMRIRSPFTFRRNFNICLLAFLPGMGRHLLLPLRSEEHTSELQSRFDLV